MKEKHTLVLIYNSYRDPLFQNLMLKYILNLSTHSHLKFHLVTFEQPQYHLNDEDIAKEKANLIKKNLIWTPLKFHTGRFILLKKVWDLLQLLKFTTQLRKKHQLEYIMAFANVSAALSGVLSKIFNLKLIIYSYEPHARFMVDMGHWRPHDLKFKILNFLETLAAKQAYHIMTGTHAMKGELEIYTSAHKISVAPTAVDPDDFQFSAASRTQIRQKLEVDSQKVFLYIGKLGGLYYEKETIAMMCQVSQWDEEILSVIITDYDHVQIRHWVNELNGDIDRFKILPPVNRDMVSAYLSAADVGIIGIPPLPNQKFRSPTKTAEYMLCGLPILICDHISEDSQYISEHHLGCVVQSFKHEDVLKQKDKILYLFEENRDNMTEKSRKIALKYRSIDKVYKIYNKIYLGK